MARKPINRTAPLGDEPIDTSGSNGGEIEQGNGSADNGSVGAIGAIDPATLTGSGSDADGLARNGDGTLKLKSDGTPAKKRGRKAGSGGNRSVSSGQNNNQDLKTAIDSLSQMIGFVHLGIATVSKTPELQLDPRESQALAQATANVMAQFDMTPDPRVIAVVGLITTASTIYMPRVYVVKARKAKEKEERKKAPISVPNAATQFDPGSGPIDPDSYNLGG